MSRRDSQFYLWNIIWFHGCRGQGTRLDECYGWMIRLYLRLVESMLECVLKLISVNRYEQGTYLGDGHGNYNIRFAHHVLSLQEVWSQCKCLPIQSRSRRNRGEDAGFVFRKQWSRGYNTHAPKLTRWLQTLLQQLDDSKKEQKLVRKGNTLKFWQPNHPRSRQQSGFWLEKISAINDIPSTTYHQQTQINVPDLEYLNQ